MRQTAIISLGGNDLSVWGGPQATVDRAMQLVAELSEGHSAASRLYATPAFPAGAGPDFVNAVMRIETSLTPDALLQKLHAIEAAALRKRTVRWGQRTLDLDLIAVDDLVLPDAATHAHWRDLPLDRQMQEAPQRLILPHPRMQDRAFVLVPLMDVAPTWVHPVLGQSVSELCAAIPAADRATVVPLTDSENT